MSEEMEKARRRARALEKSVEQAKGELARRAVEGQAAGGLVKATVSGDQTLLALEISPEAIGAAAADPARAGALRAMVIEAVNTALGRSKEMARAVLGQAAGGVRIPGLT